MNIDSIYIVIPAYEPDDKLIAVVEELTARTDYRLIVVNDGSGRDKDEIFDMVRDMTVLLEHEVNRGKGAALRTAFEHIRSSAEGSFGVITADSDGQHKVKDIARIADALRENPDRLIMGCRRFTGDIPLRSRFGNKMTCMVFKFAAGVGVSDTQTGLRGFSGELLDFMLALSGDRYEYEMNMLLEAAREGVGFYEVPIETVYINDNEGSHFNPIKDSLRIYKDIIKFSCSSLISFAVDYLLYSIIFAFTGKVKLSNVIARVFSSCFNFVMNKRVVFKNKESVGKTAAKYFSLAGVILLINTTLLGLCTKHFIKNEYAAKGVIEVLLFFFSWTAQRSFVFKKKGRTLNEQK